MPREKINVCLYDTEGHFLENFESLSELAVFLKVAQPEISQCINMERLTVNGFQVRKRTNKIQPERIGDVTGLRANTFCVAKYWNDRLITVYRSINDASEANGISSGNISACIENGWKSKGFTFKRI